MFFTDWKFVFVAQCTVYTTCGYYKNVGWDTHITYGVVCRYKKNQSKKLLLYKKKNYTK